jgi:hypothetical protein
VLSGDGFESLIFFLPLFLAVALDRKPAWCRVPLINELSSLYTPTNRKGQCMSYVISMHRPSDQRQTAVNDLSKVILCLGAPRFKHSTLVVHIKQHNHSDTAAPCVLVCLLSYFLQTCSPLKTCLLDFIVEKILKILVRLNTKLIQSTVGGKTELEIFSSFFYFSIRSLGH